MRWLFMKFFSKFLKIWAWISMILITAVILFLFGYVFYQGYETISWTFLTDSPTP